MPWNDQSGGGRPGGPWGGGDGDGDDRGSSGPRNPWGQSRPASAPPNDLEEMMRRLQSRMRGGGMGGRGRGPGGGEFKLDGRGWAMIGGAALLLWAASGVYIVNPGEAGVVKRFGVWVRTSDPGFHVHLPQPIESVQVESVSAVRQTSIGPGDADAGAEGAPGGENLMITRDQALVNLGFTVQWSLKDPVDFVFNVRNPPGDEDEVVAAAAESAMREVVGQRELDAVITTDQAGVADATRELTQRILDSYRSGIEIRQINLRARPPAAVSDAFSDVLGATQDRETSINSATAYSNQVIARAQGEAQQIINAAQAYREQTVRDASGEAERFNLLYEEYRRNPRVTRDRLYLERMEQVFKNADKIIIDGSGVNTYIPLENLRRAPQAGSNTAPAAQAAPQGGGQ